MTERRKPQKTPGTAVTDGPPNDDFTLPASLYYDTAYFLVAARTSGENNDFYEQQRNLRAALYCGFAFFEATLNQAAFAHATTHATNLGQPELDILQEKETTVDQQGHVIRRTRFYPLDVRLLFLTLFLSGQDFDRSTTLWQRFQEAKALRDAWTHPKPPFDTGSFTFERVHAAIKTLRDVLVEISKLMDIPPAPWMPSLQDAMAYYDPSTH
jgi:hypothetical protein